MSDMVYYSVIRTHYMTYRIATYDT